MKKILLLGSGELGKEFVISAQRKGQYIIACDSYAGAPAMQVADEYEVILGWNNLRNTAKANMHKEDFRINPIVYATKIQIKMSYPFVF